MRKLRVYLDTSVISFYHAEDTPKEMAITREFFEPTVASGGVVAHVSPVVAAELARTEDPAHRQRLLDLLATFALAVLPVEPEDEILALGEAYRLDGAIPPGKPEDALHVAICTVHEMDVLVSWNYRHLANVNRERRVLAVNQRLGYLYPLRITTPFEVLDYGRD